MRHRFQIHLVTDRKQARGEFARSVGAALRGGVDWAQLREKSAPALGLYKDAVEIVPEAHGLRARVSVNDRVDVALAAGADGVHLAARSLPPEAARALIPPSMLLGVSVRNLEEAREAVEAGADYVTFGHVYPTSSKPGLPPRGVRQLATIVRSLEAPVLAIGGIGVSNVREVLATGTSGIAVISAVLAADDPEAAARRLREAVDDAPFGPEHPFPEPMEGARRHALDREPGIRGG